MNTLFPALRSSSLLSPFLGNFLTEFNDVGWQPTTGWIEESVSFRMDIAEYKDRYILTADLPGIQHDEIELTLNNSRLTIEVKPHTEVQNARDAQVNYIIHERRIRAMSRTVLLPYVTSEKNIDASMKDGVLTVTINKDESLMPKKITVH